MAFSTRPNSDAISYTTPMSTSVGGMAVWEQFFLDDLLRLTLVGFSASLVQFSFIQN